MGLLAKGLLAPVGFRARFVDDNHLFPHSPLDVVVGLPRQMLRPASVRSGTAGPSTRQMIRKANHLVGRDDRVMSALGNPKIKPG